MKKVLTLVLGFALMAGAHEAAAQDRTIRMHGHLSFSGGYMGIRYDEERVISDRRPISSRVIIEEVSKGSPAEKAGLRAGDEILRINGLAAGNGKFAAVARTLVEGDTVKLHVKRGNDERDYTIVAAARPNTFTTNWGDRTIIISADSIRALTKEWLDSAKFHMDSMHLPRFFIERDSSLALRFQRMMPLWDTLMFRHDTAFIRKWREGVHGNTFRFEEFGPGPIIRSIEAGSRAIAGAEFTEFDPAMKSYFGTDRGLLTLRVAPETPAAKAGLQPGDVIVKANDRAINRVADLREIMWQRPETLKLEIVRKGETKTLDVPVQRRRSEDL